MKVIPPNIVFAIAAWMLLFASAVTAVSVAVNANVGDNVVSVEPSGDNPEVTDRDKTGTSRPSNFALAPQVKKKEALMKKASFEAERAGFEYVPLHQKPV